MVLIVIIVTAYLAYTGYSYYHTPLEERFKKDFITHVIIGLNQAVCLVKDWVLLARL